MEHSYSVGVVNSAHLLLDRDGQHDQQLRGEVTYLTRMNTAYRVTQLYANGIYTRNECHAMILVSWIETFISIRSVIIQMKLMK